MEDADLNIRKRFLNLRHNPQPETQIMDPGSAFYDHFRGGEAPSDVIVVCRSRIHDQMAVSVAVAVDCALRLRTFLQKFLTVIT